MIKKYLYLVRNKDLTQFKIGYTINPRSRSHQYTSHQPETEYVCHTEIPDKKYEKLVHYELLKRNFKYVVSIHKTEWMIGTLNIKEFNEIIQKVIGD